MVIKITSLCADKADVAEIVVDNVTSTYIVGYTITNCVDDVARRMRSNRLQLNTAKTEILWSTTSRRSHQLPQLPLRVGTDEVTPASVVRDLGIYIDSDVSMRSHVTKTVSACFAVLRQLRSVRRSVPRSVLQSLVTSPVLTRLDHGNAMHSRRHSAAPAEAASVSDELCCLTGVFLVEVRAHHPTPPSTTLVEGGGAD